MAAVFLVGCTPKEDEPGTTPPVEGEDQPEDDNEGEKEEGTPPEEPAGEVVIGNGTELTGDWVPYWTNNAGLDLVEKGDFLMMTILVQDMVS